MRAPTPMIAKQRAEDCYRLHVVYGFSWEGLAEEFGYKSPASARSCASRFKSSALRMFYDIPTIQKGAQIQRVKRQYEENFRQLIAAFGTRS